MSKTVTLLVTLLTLSACGGAAPAPAPSRVEPSAAAPSPQVTVAAPPTDAPATPSEAVDVAAPPPASRSYGHLLELAGGTPLSRVVTPAPPVSGGQDYAAWRAVRRIAVGVSHLTFAALYPDERHVITMGLDEKLRVYDLTHGKFLSTTQLAPKHQALALWPHPEAPFGAAPVITGPEQTELVNTVTGESMGQLPGVDVRALRWTRDGKIAGLVTSHPTNQSGTLRFLDQQQETLLVLESSERIEDWALSADGRHLAVCYYPSNLAEVLDLEAGRVIVTHRTPKYTSTLDLSPDGRFLAIAGDEVWVVPIASPSELQVYRGLKNNADHVRFSPSGDALVVTSYDGHARVLKRSGGDELTLVKALRHGGTANVYVAEFSRDGSHLLTSSGDRSLIWWGK